MTSINERRPRPGPRFPKRRRDKGEFDLFGFVFAIALRPLYSAKVGIATFDHWLDFE
jgi:hypothetical protein